MRGIFIPDCTQEEIAEILMYARRGANNSMIGIHKHYISVEDTELPRWIPVSERLPEDMQRVLIWFEYYRYGDFNCMYQTYGFGYVCDGKWSPFINGETGWQDYKIIAWQTTYLRK